MPLSRLNLNLQTCKKPLDAAAVRRGRRESEKSWQKMKKEKQQEAEKKETEKIQT